MMSNIVGGDACLTGRVELKYVIPAVNLPDLHHWMRCHAHPIQATHPERKIYNLYFDSAELDCYAENLAGIAQRTKLRVRWSGCLSSIRAGNLEIKSKIRGLGFKRREFLPEEIVLTGHRWRNIVRLVKKQLPISSLHAVALTRYPMPTIMNSYIRNYYQGIDNILKMPPTF